MPKRGNSPRAQVGLRVKEALRAQLEKAAKAGNKSINAEITARLEMSFHRSEVDENFDDLIAAVKSRSDRCDAPPSCGGCHYFVSCAAEVQSDGEHRYGHCHYRAPTTEKRGAAEWPSVWDDYWCGDFEVRAATDS